MEPCVQNSNLNHVITKKKVAMYLKQFQKSAHLLWMKHQLIMWSMFQILLIRKVRFVGLFVCFVLSCWDLPNHEAHSYVVSTLRKPLMSKAPPRWYHNQLLDIQCRVSWFFILFFWSLKIQFQFPFQYDFMRNLGCTFSTIRKPSMRTSSMRWLIIFRPIMQDLLNFEKILLLEVQFFS